MSEPGTSPTPRTTTPPPEPAKRSTGAATFQFVRQHPVGILHAIFFALVAIVILQNLDPTRFQLLFWSFPQVPMIVALLGALIAGALLWEILRRLLFRKRS